MSNINEKKKIFDPMADDSLESRKIIKGKTTNINNFNQVKYKWTSSLYREMLSFFWIPEIIPLASEKTVYRRELSQFQKKSFDETLSFLIFLDSIQATMLPNLSDYITAPEVSRIFALQTMMEVIHSQAYSYILESICDDSEIMKIYYYFRDNEKLLERCNQLTSFYADFRNNPNDSNLAKLIFASFALEGILFWSGFYYFYNLAYNEKMTKTADVIRLIHRDEISHMDFFQKIILEIKNELPGFLTQELFNEVFIPIVNLEKEWSIPVYGEGIPGITKQTIVDSIHYRSHVVAGLIEFDSPFPYAENPYPHLDGIGVDSGSGIKTSFFETRLTNYTQSVSILGWDKI